MGGIRMDGRVTSVSFAETLVVASALCVHCGWHGMRYTLLLHVGCECQASVPFFFSAAAIDTGFSRLQSTQRRAKKCVKKIYGAHMHKHSV